MQKFLAIVLLAPFGLFGNPIVVEIINEFQTDTMVGQKIEYHQTYSMGAFSLLNDIVVTPAGSAIIDTNLYLSESNYVVIDTSRLSGPFYLPPDSGFIKAYSDISDSITYPYDAYTYIVPVPPSGASAAKFSCWVNGSTDLWMLKDWYIDYTPTFGFENDDYEGCAVSGYVYGNGVPVDGAHVTATIWFTIYTPHPFYDQCTTYTTSDGFYSFDSLLPSRFWIKVEAAGYGVDSQLTDPLHAIQPLTDFNFSFVGIHENSNADILSAFRAYPNPFRHTTEIILASPTSTLPITIYDASGRLVKQYKCDSRQGFHYIIWDGTNHDGQPVSAGVYFVHVLGKRIKVIKL